MMAPNNDPRRLEGQIFWFRQGETFPYRPNAELFVWLNPIMQKVPYVITTFVVVFLLLAFTRTLTPLLIFLGKTLLSPLKPLLANAPTGIVAGIIMQIELFSWWFYGVLALAVVYLTTKHGLQPTHLGVSNEGFWILRYSSQHMFQCVRFIRWQSISQVDVVRPRGAKSPRDYQICITTPYHQTKLRYGDILDARDRQILINHLKSSSAAADIDEEQFAVFAAVPTRQSYTELWLRELSAPPKRDKMTPLVAGNELLDGQYIIQAKLGMGGQGTVYLATSRASATGPDATVALKEFLLPVFPDPRVRKKAAEKFQEEAEVLSRLNNERIVRFIDLFVEDHRAYLVLERAEGSTLKKLVADNGPLDEVTVISLAGQMSEILAYLHNQDPPIVHRDFTPDNLMLAPDGTLKLIDFSVAQKIESHLTGSVVGKPNYVSPEQFRGKPTQQSDIYSMGATLFYLLVGEDPAAISSSHPSQWRSSVSAELDAIVARATAVEADDRYASIEELHKDLHALKEANGSSLVETTAESDRAAVDDTTDYVIKIRQPDAVEEKRA